MGHGTSTAASSKRYHDPWWPQGDSFELLNAELDKINPLGRIIVALCRYDPATDMHPREHRMVPLDTDIKQPPEALISGMIGPGAITLVLFAMGVLFANGQVSCRGALCGVITGESIKYILLALGLFFVAYSVLYYRNFSFRLSSRNITINSGVIVRDSRTIDFGKIQNVEIRRGPFQMLLGVTSVKIWTGSMDQVSFNRNGASVRPDGLLTLYSGDAEAVRDRLVGRNG